MASQGWYLIGFILTVAATYILWALAYSIYSAFPVSKRKEHSLGLGQ